MPKRLTKWPKLSPYQESRFKQLKAWVNGVSKHNEIFNECCPDSSCCYSFLYEEGREKRVDILRKICNSRNEGPELIKALRELLEGS